MLYWINAFIFLVIGIYALSHQKSSISPAFCAIFSLTSLIMALFQMSNWLPIFILRYFLYLVSAVLLAIVPFILLALGILILLRETKQSISYFGRALSTILASVILTFFVYSLYNLINIRDVQLTIIISLYSSIAIYFTAFFISYLLISWLIKVSYKKKQPYLIFVLGTDINDEGQVKSDLKHRLNSAITFYRSLSSVIQNETYFFVSGGNAAANGMTEAEVMAHYLMKQGINKSQIILEKSARNTTENIQFTKPLIRHLGKDRSLVIVTSTYHLPRTSFFARKYQVPARYIGSKTAIISWPYAVVREFLAILLLTKEVSVFYIVYIIVTEFYKIFM